MPNFASIELVETGKFGAYLPTIPSKIIDNYGKKIDFLFENNLLKIDLKCKVFKIFF